LTDNEAGDLKRFCENHGCTQYSVLKTALHELLSKPLEIKEKEDDKDQLEINEQAKKIEKDETEELLTEKDQTLHELWKYLSKQNRT
jgi:DNA-binding MurR/RpiR family transcriptional regulator